MSTQTIAASRKQTASPVYRDALSRKMLISRVLIVGVGLCLLTCALQTVSWRSNAEIHSQMELVAALLAVMVGVLAMLRFYSKKDNTYLFVGVGFLGTALLDGYHMFVTSSYFVHVMPSSPPSLIPWSWNASRTFLAILMLLSWWAWRREEKLGKAGRVSPSAAFAVVGILTLASFCFFAFAPLPNAFDPDSFFGRPGEFVAGVFFFVALVGYSLKGGWRRERIDTWLAMSLLLGVVCQTVAMPRSFMLFDGMFDVAHLLKIVSYALVLVGLLINIFHLYGEADRSAEQLQQRVAERTIELQQRTTDLERRNAELDEFTYVASHDLQEPLRKLISFSQLLQRDAGEGLNELAQRDLHYITDASHRMQTLIQDLLELSRVGRRAMKEDVVALDECADGAMLALAAKIEETGAVIERDALPSVVGDATVLTQLYQNLICNAIKFSDAPQPQVQLTARRQDDSWVLGVRDNGIGLDPEYTEQIFRPFQRLFGREQYEGSGIGLAICKKAVERHGGVIFVESDPGVGSYFQFTLKSLPEGETSCRKSLHCHDKELSFC